MRKEDIRLVKPFRILFRSVRDSFKSIFRNFSLSMASIICSTITLVLVAIAIVVTVNVNYVTDTLEKELRKMGYDIVYNSQMFTLAEAYVIAQNSKALISLRSGFNDVLSEVKVPQFMIYTRNPFYGDLQPMYSLKDFPWVEKELIHEYNTLYQPVKEIKQDILDKIKTGKK